MTKMYVLIALGLISVSGAEAATANYSLQNRDWDAVWEKAKASLIPTQKQPNIQIRSWKSLSDLPSAALYGEAADTCKDSLPASTEASPESSKKRRWSLSEAIVSVKKRFFPEVQPKRKKLFLGDIKITGKALVGADSAPQTLGEVFSTCAQKVDIALKNSVVSQTYHRELKRYLEVEEGNLTAMRASREAANLEPADSTDLTYKVPSEAAYIDGLKNVLCNVNLWTRTTKIS